MTFFALEGSGALSGIDVETAESVSDSLSSLVQRLNLPGWIGRVIFIALVLLVTLILVRIVNRVFQRMMRQVMQADGITFIEANTSATLLSFVKYVVLALLYFFAGITTISSIPGATSTLNTLLASGGVVAVIISFAAKSALGNIAGGVMILVFKPFAVGDYIRYVDKNVSGVVEEITLRHIVIRTGENKRLIVPNGLVSDAVIENSTIGDRRVCVFYEVGITYESDLQKAKRLLAQTAEQHPLCLDNRTPEQKRAGVDKVQVKVIELADSCVKLRACVWTKDIDSSFQIKFDLNESVKEIFDQQGIDIAYPHVMILQK